MRRSIGLWLRNNALALGALVVLIPAVVVGTGLVSAGIVMSADHNTFGIRGSDIGDHVAVFFSRDFKKLIPAFHRELF